MRKGWPPEAVDLLQTYWERGLSARHCAWKINAQCGTYFTRNAVIGKAYRLGLSKRTLNTQCQQPRHKRERPLNTQYRQPRHKRERPAAARPAAPAAPSTPANAAAFETAPPPPHGVTLSDLLPHHCRWPFGDPCLPGFRFCGARRAGLLPYCAAHAEFAYRTETAREERAA